MSKVSQNDKEAVQPNPDTSKSSTVKEKSDKKINNTLSSMVEKYFLEKSGKKLRYEPTEKISVIQVDNFPELGKLTALRFIEWVQSNPNGVVSLPTGKTPEHFIKWIQRILEKWDSEAIQNEFISVGIDNKKQTFSF